MALAPPWTDQHSNMYKNRHLTQESIRFWGLDFKYTMEDRAFFLLGSQTEAGLRMLLTILLASQGCQKSPTNWVKLY